MKTTTHATLEIGTRIYYTGDMANMDGWFTVAAVHNDRWGLCYDLREVTADVDEPRDFRRVFDCAIGREYHGHGGTRFVTHSAYTEYRDAMMQQYSAKP